MFGLIFLLYAAYMNTKGETDEFEFMEYPDPVKSGQEILLRIMGPDDQKYLVVNRQNRTVDREWQFYHAETHVQNGV
jgi:hypothetical protein